MRKILLSLTLSLTTILSHSQDWTEIKSKKDANFFDLQQSFNTYWSTHDNTQKSKGYKVFKRWEYMVAPRVYPSGDLSLLTQNAANFDAFLSNTNTSNSNQTTKTIGSSNLIASSTWTAVGPIGAMTGTAVNGLPRKAGRDNFITFHPTASLSSTYWSGAAVGGLWKTTNNGTSWTTTTDNETVIGCSDLAIDPSNPNIMYMATGDGDAGDCNSIGVLKSINGGATWTVTGLTFAVNNYYLIRRLIINPANTQILMAATNAGIYRTTNGGTTWSSISNANTFDLEFKPGDPTTVYAAGTSFSLSTNSGVTFTQVSSGIPTTGANRMAIAVTNNSLGAAYVYVVASTSSASDLLGVYRSINSGVTFSTMATTPNILVNSCAASGSGGQGWYDLAIAASPLNANEVVVGGVNHWRSIDGGSTWSIIGCWNSTVSNPPYVHADVHNLAYNAAGVLYSANDGGTSEYNGTTWIDRVPTGTRNIAQIYRIGLSGTSANYWITGHQDNGSNIYNGTTYNASYPGDGLDCFVDRTNNSNLFAETPNGGLVRSTNGGASWLSANSGITESANWLCPWKQDPQTANTIYAGYNNIWKSTNLGSSWTSLSALTTTAGSVVEFAIAPTNSLVMYVLKTNKVMKTINGGTSWTDVTGTLPVGSAALTYVAIDATDPNTAWVTFSSYSAANKVFTTINGGTSWTNVTSNLPNLPANCVVYEPGTNDRIYVGMDVGVYYKDNSSANWTLYNAGLPNTVISDLEISPASPGKLRAATYGRSVYEVDVVACTTNPTVTVTPNQTICPGSSATLSASGASTYAWSNGGITSSIVVTPTAAITIYTVTGSVGACSDTKNVSVFLSLSPTIGIIASSTAICAGNSATLNATGANLFLWNTGSTATVIVVSPSVTTTYTVVGTLGTCSNSAVRTVSIIPNPTVTVSPNQTICPISAVTLTASGASTYSWSNGLTGSSIGFTPLVPTAITVTGSINGCVDTKTTFIFFGSTVSVIISATNNSICSGGSSILSASGASSFLWNTGSTATTIVVSPTTTTTYSVTGTLGSCSGSAIKTITVNPNPSLTVNNQTICPGGSATLICAGATTYTWNTGATTNSIVVSPSVNTVYTVSGSNLTCSSATTASVVVGGSLSISISSLALCSSSSGTIGATGATSYTWSTGATSSVILVNPSVTTVYTVTGSSGSCIGTKTTQVNVTPTPTFNINAFPGNNVCSGTSVTLTAIGACSNYTWSPINLTGATIVVSPTTTTAFTVISNCGTCTGFNSVTLTLQPGPTVTISASNTLICSGNSVTLTASGASTYSWSNGSTATSIVVSPTAFTTYTLFGSNGSGCIGSKTISINPVASPTIGFCSTTPTICQGGSFPIVLCPSSATSYTFSSGLTLIGSSLIATPLSTTVYSVQGSNGNCLSNTALITLTVLPNPSVTVIAAPSNTICLGGTATLTASGATTYSWNTSAIGAVTVVSPSVTTTYTVIGTTLNGCSNTKIINVFVSGTGGSPTITATPPNICAGGSSTLTASGASTYTWSTGSNATSIVVSPANTTTYTLNGTNGACNGNTSITLSVTAIPSLAVSNQTVCSGGTATLSVSGASGYTWSTGSNASIITVTPTSTTIYTVSGNNANCVNSKTVSVTIGSSLSVLITSSPASICQGGTATLTASGAASYFWSAGSTNSSIVVNPTSATTYSVLGTTGACTGSAVTTVSISPQPTVFITSNSSGTLCAGASATLLASGASTYTWSTGATGNQIVITPTSSTIYQVIGFNAGCSNTASISISVGGGSLNLSILASPSVICSSGSSTISASGATNYTWSTGVTGAVIVVTPTVTTTYTVIGTNGGCTGSSLITVSVSSSGGPLSVISTTTSGCGNACLGMVNAVTSGGNGPYTYSLNNSTCVTLPCTNLCAGIYKLYTTDASGCTTFNLFSLSNTANNLQASFTSTSASCPTCTDGIVTASGNNGIPPFTYTWSPFGGNAATATNLSPGCYTLTLKDAVGCVITSRTCLGTLTGIDKSVLTENDLLVYPNPATNNVTVKYQNEVFDILVYNGIGQLIATVKDITTETEINTTKFSRGIYFMEVKFGTTTFRKKLILE
jgi:hypothetical protein